MAKSWASRWPAGDCLQSPRGGAGKTATARLWAYGRDERPSHQRCAFGATGGDAPPASWYRFSADRKGRHPTDHLAKYRGWMHAPLMVCAQTMRGQWTATPGSTTSIGRARSARSPAWPMSGASSSTSTGPKARPLDLHRFRSGQVLMLGGLSFEGHGAFPTQG